MPDVMQRIRERVTGLGERIVLPEADDERTLRAAAMVRDAGTAVPVLVGSPDDIRALASSAGVSLDGIEVVDVHDPDLRTRCAALYYEERKSKGVTEEEAYKTMEDPLFTGAAMLSLGEVDGLVAGAVNSTPNVLRAMLRCVGCAEGMNTVSSCFIMTTQVHEMGVDGALIYADAGVVPAPTLEQLADIAISSAESARLYLETEPRVAMLSFSTHGSAKHEDAVKIAEATELVRQRRPDILIDGELQVDAALVPHVAERKAPGSAIEGRANTLIFPDLGAGNIAYKITQWLGGAGAFGPLLQGLAKPGMDLSRAATPDDIFNVAAVAALQAALRAGKIEQ
ncbi:MAG TPA: phosphate acetyltransferase [Armatimonadota bacterium]|nr:phosphate acetyltransferase [Armatimonadota bacterium]